MQVKVRVTATVPDKDNSMLCCSHPHHSGQWFPRHHWHHHQCLWSQEGGSVSWSSIRATLELCSVPLSSCSCLWNCCQQHINNSLVSPFKEKLITENIHQDLTPFIYYSTLCSTQLCVNVIFICQLLQRQRHAI